MPKRPKVISDSLWYKDAIIYELHVKSFYDSNGDGVGDFQGLIQKLGYLQELGITAIWLLPFYPSPMKDDGYDIQDYYNVNKEYGTLSDFRQFLREAHKRGIRVITELVINHTSDQHKWFQKSRIAKPDSSWRNYYVWSDTPDKYKEARVIFQDFEQSNWTWDNKAQAYYWHRFYSHQPDLNFDNPQVRKQILRVLDFWLSMGVDGMRLDAVPYLYEREGTNCENLPETHKFLKEMRAHIDGKYKDRVLLAEANQWPEDAAEYFGKGDECHMAFHFPVMPRLFMAVQMEDRFPIINMIEQSMDVPETCQWMMFLRNHDELTLEMVTDEERDYMYRAFAQDPKARLNLGIRRRLAPLLENSRRKIELLNILLLSLPGTPVLYYGDEIGMGDNYYLGDRDGVRTPMQWNPDRNAGFSRANPQQLYLPVVIDFQYHYTAINVESQVVNQSSLLWFMRRLIGMRNRFKALGRGTIEFISSNNNHVLSFIRNYKQECILVVANLSSFSQIAMLSLAECAGCVPEEVFGGNRFPPITEHPYALSLGPHSAYWFSLHKKEATEITETEQIPKLKLDNRWENLSPGDMSQLSAILPSYFRKCRWFAGKGRPIRSANIIDGIQCSKNRYSPCLLLVEVVYVGTKRETYLLPISFAQGPHAHEISQKEPQSIICDAQLADAEGVIYDGVYNEQFRDDLLGIMTARRGLRSHHEKLVNIRSRKFRGLEKQHFESRVLKGEQSNTSIFYEQSYFLKLYRRLESGVNPDAEISRYLTEYTNFRNFPSYIGTLLWKRNDYDTLSIGLLLEYVANENDAWTYTLDSVSRYFAAAAAQKKKLEEIQKPVKSISEVDAKNLPQHILDLISPVFVDMIRLLGKRTAELHIALASLTQVDEAKPEPFSVLYQKSVYQSMRALTLEVFAQLQNNLSSLEADTARQAQEILDAKQEILKRFRSLTSRKISAMKIRIHGDYHLGQVLNTGKDFVIIDFEGEPARPLSQRRLKRSALRDVAGMVRSFHYAAHGATILRPVVQTVDPQELSNLADQWYYYVTAVFLDSYIETVGDAEFLPGDKQDFDLLLGVFLLEKSIYEVGYELNNRPNWLAIPLRGVQQLSKGKL